MSLPHLKLVKTDVKKYAVGFNGHAKCCDCDRCAKDRAEEIVQTAKARKIRITDPRATVMVKSYTVRAHARRNKNHLGAYPATLKLLKKMLKEAKAKAA